MRLVRSVTLVMLAALIVAASSWWPTLDWRPSFDWWPRPEEPGWPGYVEAEFVDIGAEEAARLVALSVKRGDQVTEGEALFHLDSADAAAARDEAQARLEAAKAELADLMAGQRPEEIAAVEAQRDAAAATLQAAHDEFERKSRLLDRRVVAEAAVDEARERYQVAQARLAEAEHQLAVARLPGRPERIEAARRNAKAAQAALERAEARLIRLAPKAPVGARVEEVFFRAGELVPAGRPVVRLLPPGHLRIRFFLPQPDLGHVNVGDAVAVSCDGCPAPVEGRVSFIAEEVEFTPPVIFSVSARQKLVVMAEARPQAPNGLKVGQPVDVRLAPTREVRR